MNRRSSYQWVIGLLISLVFLVLALRGVHWAEVWASWRAARPALLLVSVAVMMCGWGVAAARWRVLLAPAPGLRIRDTFAYIAIGFFANTVLPLRLGEVARATFIGRNKGLGISRALGSIAVERVFDLLAVIAAVLLLSLLMELPLVLKTALVSVVGMALLALAILAALSFNRERLARMTDGLARFMPRRLAERLTAVAAGFAGGTGALRRGGTLAAVAGLSILLWALGGVLTLVWIRAFNLATPWYGGLFVLVLVNLGSAIPSSPGYIGVYHVMAMLALSVWVPDKGPALAYALGSHALNMLVNLVVGAVFLVREGVSLKGMMGRSG